MVSERLRSRCFFSYGSSRKSFTSFDLYFVLLEQLASLSDKWNTLKTHHAYCLKKLNHLSRGRVEDTTFEAKAKNSKKKPRPRTDVARTDPLEAKNRNVRCQGQGLQTQFFSIMVGKFFITFERESA